MVTKASVSKLARAWLNAFETSLKHALATEEAAVAFSQTIDGLPTRSTARKIYVNALRPDIKERVEPRSESLSTFQLFRKSFDVATIQQETEQTLQAYQNAPLGSVEFNLRLLGLVAVAIHDLAIQTFTRLHPHGGPSHPMKVPPVEGISVPDLSHPNYMCWHQYPHGTAELVGYFAESEILGGTVVFEHDSENEEVLQSAFIHPPMRHLFKLSGTQIDGFANLGSSPPAAAEGTPDSNNSEAKKTIPFVPEPQAQTIFDDIATYPLVYRDKYERVPKIREPEPGCVRRGYVTDDMREFAERLIRERFGSP